MPPRPFSQTYGCASNTIYYISLLWCHYNNDLFSFDCFALLFRCIMYAKANSTQASLLSLLHLFSIFRTFLNHSAPSPSPLHSFADIAEAGKFSLGGSFRSSSSSTALPCYPSSPPVAMAATLISGINHKIIKDGERFLC